MNWRLQMFDASPSRALAELSEAPTAPAAWRRRSGWSAPRPIAFLCQPF